jgi:hypothetical protein
MFMLWARGYVPNSWLSVVLGRVCISCYTKQNTFWVAWQRRRCAISTHQMLVWIIARSLEGSMMQMGKFNLPITNSSLVIMSWFALKTRGIVHFFLQPHNPLPSSILNYWDAYVLLLLELGSLCWNYNGILKSIQLMFWFFLVGFENLTTIFPFLQFKWNIC